MKEGIVFFYAIIIYLLLFYFAVFMGDRVEKQRLHEKHKQEAYWSVAK
jgi:hypothetical protein